MLNSEDHKFLAGAFDRLEGWCLVEAAAITLYLQRYQMAQGWSAPNCEIGVFKGKYLSALQRAAAAMGQHTTGIDIFTTDPKWLVEDMLHRELGDCSNLRLVEKNSGVYTPEDLRAEIGGPASWISVDGDHTAEGVQRDLANAEASIAPWGIIAIDDFVNANAIGVVEGAILYLANSGSDLRPFCFCANKLLVCRSEYVDRYHAAVPDFCAENSRYRMANDFMQRYSGKDRSWCIQRLLGRDIWLIA